MERLATESVHLHRLEELEYLVVHRGGRGQSFVYELVFEREEDSARPALPGLIEIAKLSGCEYDENEVGARGQKSGSSPAQAGGCPGVARVGDRQQRRGRRAIFTQIVRKTLSWELGAKSGRNRAAHRRR